MSLKLAPAGSNMRPTEADASGNIVGGAINSVHFLAPVSPPSPTSWSGGNVEERRMLSECIREWEVQRCNSLSG